MPTLTGEHYIKYQLDNYIITRKGNDVADVASYVLSVDVVTTFNPGGLNGTDPANVAGPSASLSIRCHSLQDDLGITYAEIKEQAREFCRQAIRTHYIADYESNWCGEGQTGFSNSTNAQLNGQTVSTPFDTPVETLSVDIYAPSIFF